MAKKAIIKHNQLPSNKNNLVCLRNKLAKELEDSIKLIYKESKFCDLELIADSASIFTNSCLLQVRAPNFYIEYVSKHITGYNSDKTKIYFPNSTFFTIQTFIECIYTSENVGQSEEKVIKQLQEIISKNKLVKKKCLSPDIESFYTPECSPSSFSKPFETDIVDGYRQIKSVQSYYTIVSVDDIDLYKDKSDCSLDKELAEQDQLFLSFQSINSKESQTNYSSHYLKPVVRKTNKLTLDLYNQKVKSKQPLWKPNKFFVNDSRHNELINMDVNTSGLESCLNNIDQTSYVGVTKADDTTKDYAELSSSAVEDQIEVDMVESSVSSAAEQSGNKLEEGYMTGLVVCSAAEQLINSSDENETTDILVSVAAEECYVVEASSAEHLGEVPIIINQSRADLGECTLCEDLPTEDLRRLDEMEKNIEVCEKFLKEERSNVTETAQDLIRNSSDKNTFFHCEMCSPSEENRSFAATVEDNLNIMNKKLTAQEISDTSKKKSEENPTPPCSPLKKWNCVEQEMNEENKVYLGEKESDVEEIEKVESKINYWDCTVTTSNNYFIDASSLLDDSEITSQPVSLTNNFTSCNNEPETDGVKMAMMREVERQQGELIFKSSIPHFSLHELDAATSTSRLRGGDDDNDVTMSDCRDDNEQVVPTTDDLSPDCEQQQVTEEEKVNRDKRVMDTFPIVSGGVSPRDYSTTPSSTGSPSTRRRNENVPIISGGSEFVEEKKQEKRLSQSQGSAWIVDMSESDNDNSVPEHKTVTDLKRTSKRERNSSVGYFIDMSKTEAGDAEKEENVKNKTRASFPIEKSVSLGYFLDFGKNSKSFEEKSLSRESLEKKNLFSMFIDINENDEKKPATDTKVKVETVEKVEQVEKPSKKKGFFMFIEHESPLPKRKISAPGKLFKPDDGSLKKTHKRAQSLSVNTENVPADVTLTVEETTPKPLEKYGSLKLRKLSNNKLPLKTVENKTTWEEQNVNNKINVSNESWLSTNDVQVTYKTRPEPASDDAALKKDSTFILDSEKEQKIAKHKSNKRKGEVGSKQTKCEEIDSGVVATEDSDDGFVKLSDLDKDSKKKTTSMMSKSINENNDRESKLLKVVKKADAMSKSVEWRTSSKQNGFSTDPRVCRSLSRIFPNVNLSSSLTSSKRSSLLSPTNPDQDMMTSQVSEISSYEPSCLEISTSETDVSLNQPAPVSRLGEDLLRMFLEEISPDVTVEVGGRRIKAHKCILSSRCQYFAAMLSGGWVESAGNVISLQGFSYNVVHFALCHVYSGESKIPDSLNLIELATLADMLCLEGLKEVISYTLKVKYCHFFHNPCAGCMVGVLDCLPVAAAYGLDELYRKCLRWITKHFVRVWPTKTFSSLPKELLDKCYQHHIVHMSAENILDTIMSLDKLRGMLPNVRWADIVSRIVNKLQNAAIKYIAEHFSSVLTSDSFLALGKEAGWSISCYEDILMEATERLPPEQACWSHARLHRILSLTSSSDCTEEVTWNEDFLELLQKIAGSVENNLVKQAPRAARSKAWRQMEPELRSKIQEAACLVLPDDCNRTLPKRVISESSSTSSVVQRQSTRNFDIRQVKLAMTQQKQEVSTGRSRRTQRQQQLTSVGGSCVQETVTGTRRDTRTNTNKTITKQESTGLSVRKSYQRIEACDLSVPKVKPSRLLEVKSRYLEQRSPLKTLNDKPSAPVSSAAPLRRQISSSDSSRTCSPAMRRAPVKTASKQPGGAGAVIPPGRKFSSTSERLKRLSGTEVKFLGKLGAEENMSTDSLATESSYSERDVGCRTSEINTKPINKLNYVNSPMLAKRNQIGQGIKRSVADNKTTPSLRNVSLAKVNDMKQTKRITDSSSNRSQLYSPRNAKTSASGRVLKTQPCVNGNVVVNKRNSLDVENNQNDVVRPSIGSRSGTFLKDELTILKKPGVTNVRE